LSLIVAMARNRVIGHNGKLPWHLSADLKRFKALTMGHHIVMGRHTWESIGRPLPGRVSVVVTRNGAYAAPGAIVVDSLPAALQLAADDPEVFVIGGWALYREALRLADRVYLTELPADYPGDVFFPDLPTDEWRFGQREIHAAEGDQPAWSFVICERKSAD
jgi:dihydrofolate reductase